MCALSDDVLLLACGSNGIREMSLSSAQLCERDPSELIGVYNLAFNVASETLVLAVMAPDDNEDDSSDEVFWLVTLHRDANKWREVQRMRTDQSASDVWVHLSFVDNSRVLFGLRGADSLHAFDMSVAHSIRAVGSIALEQPFEIIATTCIGNEAFVAATETSGSYVSLYRLVALRLEPLARTELSNSLLILFRGDLLFVSKSKTEVVSFRVTGGRLIRERTFLTDYIEPLNWCFAGNQLVVDEMEKSDLLLYAFN